MASRNFSRKQALEKEVKELYATVSIGASGAPTIVQALGIASIARDSAGLYTLTLQDKYNKLLSFDMTLQAAAAEDIRAQLAAQDVVSAKTIQFRTVASATETDPSDGSTMYIKIDLKNTSVPK